MTDPLIRFDRRFLILREALVSPVDRALPAARGGHRVQAAVSVVIRGGDHLELLLIKRSLSERDPWSGHMALPGGRRDPDDIDLQHTARRETREETGVDLLDGGAHLGRLEDVSPSSKRLAPLTVSSFVFGVPGDTPAAVASHEVAQVFWVPLDELRDPNNHGEVEKAMPSGTLVFPCFHLVGEEIWGLTHRILTRFLSRYPEHELSALDRP